MNIPEIQQSIIEAIQAKFVGIPVVGEINDETIPNQGSFIVVGLENVQNVVGPLWKANAVFSVVSYAPQVTQVDHSALVASISGILNTGSFFSSIPLMAGFKFQSSQSMPQDNAYHTMVTVLVGIQSS